RSSADDADEPVAEAVRGAGEASRLLPPTPRAARPPARRARRRARLLPADDHEGGLVRLPRGGTARAGEQPGAVRRLSIGDTRLLPGHGDSDRARPGPPGGRRRAGAARGG